MNKNEIDYNNIDCLCTFKYKDYFINCHNNRKTGKTEFYTVLFGYGIRYNNLEYLKRKIRKYIQNNKKE